MKNASRASIQAFPPRFRTRLARALLILAICMLGGADLESADRAAGESQIKAAFLSNFAKFISWQGARPNPGGDFAIGVLGDDPFADELRSLVRGRSIGGRSVRVKVLHVLADAMLMDVLFVPAGLEQEMSGHVSGLRRSGVLTVGESPRFAEMGGIINFQLQSGKIRFAINREAAAQAGLKISPQLLKLSIGEGGAK
ncbi:MAG: YfiR family protein [Prosthecobacter sp.]